MGKAEDAVNKIEGYDEEGGWYGDDGMAGDNEAKNSLDALVDLNGADFATALDQLDPSVTQKLIAASRSQGLDKKDEYREIVNALQTGNPENVVKSKDQKAADAEKPKFADGHGWELPDEKDHLYRVDLYQPKGASASLISLIEDTEFTMQWGFDTLGARDPKAAPEFTNVLEGQQVTSADGWSQVRNQHSNLKGQLDKRQTEYTEAHKGVKVDTNDSAILNSDTFKKLKRITEDLNEKLQFEFPNSKVVDGKIKYSYKDVDNSSTEIVAYEKNNESGNYYLTAAAEQLYYVKHIDAAAESWDKEYENATKEFQKKAENVDNKNAGDHSNNNANNNNNNNNGNNNNSANNNNGTGYNTPPASTQDPSTQPSGTATNDDWGSTYEDLLGGPTDTDGSLTDPTAGAQPISNTGTGDTSSATDPLAAIRSALQGGTGSATGTGPGTSTGTNSGNVASTGNSGDNGMAKAMQDMAMMSAMSGMMNQGRQPEDDRLERAYAEREREREKREERERNRNAQTTTAQQAVQQTGPAGVTPPTYAGTPPPITAPGTTPAVQIGDTTVNASPPVAEALQKQTQNVALDAISAYKGTAGEITAEHPPAVVNGPGELKTGDILQWEKHSALVVKNENGLFVLDNGQLVPLDPNNPPLKEKYGNFAGFIHPTGLDTAAGSAPGIAAPPPPAVAAAPQPAAPPPVSPPPQGV